MTFLDATHRNRPSAALEAECDALLDRLTALRARAEKVQPGTIGAIDIPRDIGEVQARYRAISRELRRRRRT